MDYTKKTTQVQPQPNNTMLYILSAVVIVLFAYIGYVYYANDMVKKGDLKAKYILKDDVSFDILPEYIKTQYVELYTHNAKIRDLNYKIENLSSTSSYVEPKTIEKIVEVEKVVYVDKKIPVEKIVYVDKIVEIEKEIPVEKVVYVDKIVYVDKKIPVEKEVEKIVYVDKIVEVEKEVEVEKVIYVDKLVELEKPLVENTTVSKETAGYNVYQCYDMTGGGIYPSQNCKNKLNNFLEENKNSLKFEVIGVVNHDEFIIMNKYKDENYKTKIKRLAELAQIGLSRKRVIEGIWNIKNFLGVSTNTQSVNYTITSDEGLAGFIVRAYK